MDMNMTSCNNHLYVNSVSMIVSSACLAWVYLSLRGLRKDSRPESSLSIGIPTSCIANIQYVYCPPPIYKPLDFVL